MEPLDVAATDWIKDYDPLFELFEEEMQMGSTDTAAVAAASHTWPTAMAACDATYYTPISDYYYTAASFAATTQPLVQQYHATPTTTTSYATQSADGYDLSQYYNQQYHHQVATVVQPCMTANATSSTQTDPYNKVDQQQHQQQQQQQQEIQPATQQTDDFGLLLGLDWLPCLENELPAASSPSSTLSSTISSAPVTPALSLIQSETASTSSSSSAYSSTSSSSSAYSSTAPSPTATSPPCDTASAPTKGSSKKRKPPRSKGISLLAQPSPKVITIGVSNNVANTNNPITTAICNITTSSPAQVTATASTPAPTRLLTTKNVPILKISRTASLQQSTNLVGIGSTTATATLVTYSSIANVVRQNSSTTLAASIANTATASSKITTNSANDIPVVNATRQLSKLELTNKLCASIEHNYALAPT